MYHSRIIHKLKQLRLSRFHAFLLQTNKSNYIHVSTIHTAFDPDYDFDHTPKNQYQDSQIWHTNISLHKFVHQIFVT